MKKKFLLSLLMTISILCTTSCGGKQTGLTGEESELVVENIIQADREYMLSLADSDYYWYETAITLNDYVDSENCNNYVTEVTNVFQYINQETNNIEMLMITHNRDTTIYDTHSTIRIGYSALNDEPIKLTFKEAYQRLLESNAVLPHTKSCSLCLNSVPGCDTAEYEFSTDTVSVYVNAVTGDVTSDVYEDTDEYENTEE